MANERTLFVVAVLLTFAVGCVETQGLLYTHTVAPYDLPTGTAIPKATKTCAVDITQLKEPLTRANISVMWSDHAVMEAFRRAGMTDIRYVDIETLSVLNGTYRRRRLVFHGE